MLRKRKPYGADKNSVAVHTNIVYPVSITCVIIHAVLRREVNGCFCFCWKDITQTQQRTESPAITPGMQALWFVDSVQVLLALFCFRLCILFCSCLNAHG